MLRLSPAVHRRLLVASAVAVGAIVWVLLWSARSQSPATVHPSENAVPPPPLAFTAPPRAGLASPSEESGTDDDGPRPALDWRDPATHERLVEAGEPDCPWPPHPDSWHALDEPCEAALNRFFLTDDWRRVLDDALGSRRAVTAALENPACRPHDADAHKTEWSEWPRWRGEHRPDLRDACAADAMVRLAKLQHTCVPRLRRDVDGLDEVDQHYEFTRDIDDLAVEYGWDQESYYRAVATRRTSLARSYWQDHMCRSVPMAAFRWLDQLPVPPGDDVRTFDRLSPNTQALHLYDAARRLGAEVPVWTLPRDLP